MKGCGFQGCTIKRLWLIDVPENKDIKSTSRRCCLIHPQLQTVNCQLPTPNDQLNHTHPFLSPNMKTSVALAVLAVGGELTILPSLSRGPLITTDTDTPCSLCRARG